MSWNRCDNYYDDYSDHYYSDHHYCDHGYAEVATDHPLHDPVGRLARLINDVVAVVRPVVESPLALAKLKEIECELQWMADSAPHYVERTRSWHVDDRPIGERLRSQVADMVGGIDALVALDDAPLADEPLVLPDLDADLRERIEKIAAMCDACNDAMFDVEHRTATRRLIMRIARHGARGFRSKTKDERLAAALCWVVAASNESLGGPRSVSSRDLLDHFGVKSSVSHNAATLLEPAGLAVRYGTPQLVWPRYLVSARRREIIDLRDEMTSTA